MESTLFGDLVNSTKQAGAIHRGEEQACRTFKVELPNVKSVREKTVLSQTEFAQRLHISARTLQNWEQHRRYPTGPAVTLIRILDRNPELIA